MRARFPCLPISRKGGREKVKKEEEENTNQLPGVSGVVDVVPRATQQLDDDARVSLSLSLSRNSFLFSSSSLIPIKKDEGEEVDKSLHAQRRPKSPRGFQSFPSLYSWAHHPVPFNNNNNNNNTKEIKSLKRILTNKNRKEKEKKRQN